MDRKILSLAGAIGFGLALSLAAPAAQAAMPAQATTASSDLVTQVWGGCGPYGHRGPWGGCRGGGQWGGGYYRPYRPYYAPRPLYRPYYRRW